MSSRRNYIVTYDIRDPKRLRKVFQTCRDFGQHLQFSVFECDLTDTEKTQFEQKLRTIIKHDEDQVLFIDLGLTAFRGERTITALGQTYQKIDAPCFIV
ncbi:MAG: CRISPR-associated endonuclease Cas2 [Puniceicoccales bacterium]|jgi:CRISPR-associated protein Cas2|nr:CRISPR-associated endonuclease Cas2 [Puniceicoccales bacterium]